MQPTKIVYSRRKELTGLNSEEIRLEIQILPGETADQALDLCRRFVAAKLDDNISPDVDRARQILADPEPFTYGEVKAAQKLLSNLPPPDTKPIL